MSNHSNDTTAEIHRELAEQGVEYLEGLDTVLYEIEQAILPLTDPIPNRSTCKSTACFATLPVLVSPPRLIYETTKWRSMRLPANWA